MNAMVEKTAAEKSTTESVDDGLLRDLWYFALPSRDLRQGGLVGKTILGEPVVFARRDDGTAYALRDICPHRGIPLRHGRMVEGTVECPYHGWRFNGGGVCTAIPSLVEGQEMSLDRIKVRAYPLVERQGCIWIFMGPPGPRAAPDEAEAAARIAPPELPLPADARPKMTRRVFFPCHVDHAVIGLMDPAHGPFVHRSWWWRSSRSIHPKAKDFAPRDHGFAMVRHKPSSNSGGYRVLGGEISTEITFRLPSVRVEHMRAGKRQVVGLTAVTPLTATTTELHQIFYWDIPILSVLKPILGIFARQFLNQDLNVVVKQQEGLAHQPNLMLINDADVQAKWYFRLKRAWQRARDEGQAFENPVPETTLRWRS